MDRKKLIQRLIFLIFFIFLVNLIANKFYWYFSIWYFDMIMHFLGGFWLGLAYFYIFSFLKDSFLGAIFKALLFVLLVGMGWEVFEMFVNEVVTQNPFNLLDTTSDIFFDLIGGTFAVFYFFKRIMIDKESRV